MVSVCAGCNDYKPWAALLVGFVAGCAFIAWHYALLRFKIDDPLDAVAGEKRVEICCAGRNVNSEACLNIICFKLSAIDSVESPDCYTGAKNKKLFEAALKVPSFNVSLKLIEMLSVNLSFVGISHKKKITVMFFSLPQLSNPHNM